MEYWDEKSLEYKYQMTQVFEKLPEFIQKIVEKLFNNNVLSLFSFKHDYDPEERKANQEFVRKHNLFNKREIELISKTTKIENRVYNKDELRIIKSNIIDDILSKSSKNGDIQKANEEFCDILEKIDKVLYSI